MQRRRAIATIGAFLLAGCGWQETDDGSSGNGNGNRSRNPIAASDDGNGEQDENGQQDGSNGQDGNGGDGGSGQDGDETGEPAGGGESIDRDAEELLLTEDDFASEEWEVQNVQRTGTCRVFERPYENYTLIIESCAEVFDDEETAIEEYENEVDIGTNLVGDPANTEIEIGDDAVALVGGPDAVRVIFRDANAYGVVDYEAEGRLNIETLPEAPEIVALARAMHDRWRE